MIHQRLCLQTSPSGSINFLFFKINESTLSLLGITLNQFPGGETRMKTTLLVLSALVLNTTLNGNIAHAANSAAQLTGELQAIQAALDARNEFVTALENKDFTAITHQGFSHAIEVAIQDLRDRSDNELADELQAQWQKSDFMGALFASQFRDLGDHAPLFSWLDDFFNKMAAKYGTIIFSLPYVKDLRTLNFAIPVVFTPKGKGWQQAGVDARIEYRKHFIPFANIITYYAALFGCNYVASKQGLPELKKLCGKAADKLQFVMGRYIAPVVSDWIFKAANHGSSSSIQIGSDRLRYNTADDLRQAIQQ